MRVLLIISFVAAQYNRDFNLRDLCLLSKSNQLTLDELEHPEYIYEGNAQKLLDESVENQNSKYEHDNQPQLFKEALKQYSKFSVF